MYTLAFISKKWNGPKTLYTNIHASFIYVSLNLEAAQIFSNK